MSRTSVEEMSNEEIRNIFINLFHPTDDRSIQF